MRSLTLPTILSLLLASDLPSAVAKQAPKNAILLSQVQTLTLRGNGAKTTHRRLPAVPQLKCISSPSICRLYDMDVMRCTNQGSGYDGEDVQWSCTSNLPPELKLGSTDVICEGYHSSDDPYVLKGSCGVEYRLALTKEGERRYPDIANGGGSGWFGEDHDTRRKGDLSGYLFAAIFIAVFAWILYSACVAQDRNRRLGGGRRGGGGGGWGGWGGGGGGGDGPGGWQPWNDPPPPYSGTKPSWSARNEGWRPGFWSGLASGAAGGYYAGSRRSNRDAGYRTRGGSGWGSSDAGPSGTSSWGSSSSSSNTRESTGFGSTSRR